jgi:hypothetical protein
MGLSAESSVRETGIQRRYAPSTMRTLIGGTMLGSVGFDFLIGDGDAACGRRLPEPHLGACLAPVGDVRGDEGGEVVLRRTSIAPVLFAT